MSTDNKVCECLSTHKSDCVYRHVDYTDCLIQPQPSGRATMWLTEFSHGRKGRWGHVPRGWFVRESEGVIVGTMFIPDDYDPVAMDRGYVISEWAFLTQDEAIHTAAMHDLKDVLDAMSEAEYRLATARQRLIDERMKNIRGIAQKDADWKDPR